jgi:hypothetical protein
MISTGRFFKKSLKVFLSSLCLGLIIFFSPGLQETASAKSVLDSSIPGIEALRDGTVSGSFRASFENSDLENNGTNQAIGLTVQSRLNYRTADGYDWQLFAQVQDVSPLVDNYAPENPGFDRINDPNETSMHQVYLDYKGLSSTLVRLGRQEIILNNARLIGNILWRQGAQSFDAGLINHQFTDGISIKAAYVNQVKTALDTRIDLNHMAILQSTFSPASWIRISPYWIGLDSKNGGPAGRGDKATYGIRWTGSLNKVGYAFDYNQQTEYADATQGGGQMYNVSLSRKFSGLKLRANYSFLEGQDGNDRSFDTLFSTAHKFNGWTDQFFRTNHAGGGLPRGLVNWFVQAGTALPGGVKFLVRYHQHQQETRSQNYGTELESVVKKKFYDDLKGLVKFAQYNADRSNNSGVGENDERIVWTRLMYTF